MARAAVIKPDIGAHYIYCVAESGCIDSGPSKIGITCRPDKRLSSLQAGNWRRIHYAWIVSVESKAVAVDAEAYILRLLRPSPYTAAPSFDPLPSEWVRADSIAALSKLTCYLDAVGEIHGRKL